MTCIVPVFYLGHYSFIVVGYQIYNNAVNGPIDASGIQSTGTFNVENNIFTDPNKMNLYPAVNSLIIKAGIHLDSQLVTYDFNGKIRLNTTPTVGAYVSEYTISYYTRYNPDVFLFSTFSRNIGLK